MKLKVKARIAACLWLDSQGEDAANCYISIFKNSRITNISYFGKEGFDIYGHREGAVMAALFELDGQPLAALNGGPQFTFNKTVSR